MSEPLRLVGHVQKALQALAETDLSFVQQAAVLRIAAESCTQAHILNEIVHATNKGRNA